jgi:hypothetical protein
LLADRDGAVEKALSIANEYARAQIDQQRDQLLFETFRREVARDRFPSQSPTKWTSRLVELVTGMIAARSMPPGYQLLLQTASPEEYKRLPRAITSRPHVFTVNPEGEVTLQSS